MGRGKRSGGPGDPDQPELYLPMVGEFTTVWLALFTLLLACVGLYGIVAHAVASRHREMGIRLANGATTAGVVRMVVGEGLRPILLGILVGAVGAGAAARVTESLLFGVSRSDPWSHGAAVLLLLFVGIGACYLPARLISRLDPTEALRGE